MHDPQPRLDELPESFPAFPLTGALLLPGARLPLNIFEPRYLAMTEDALAQGRAFAMIQANANLPAGATGPGLYGVGCLGRLTSFSETENGHYLITLTGLIRFDVVEELPMTRGYRRLRGDFSRFAADLDQTADAGIARDDLLADLRAYFRRRGFDANWDAIGEMTDRNLVDSLAMVCPFEPAERQALLEAIDLTARTQTLRALLTMDMHEGPAAADPPQARRRLSS
jgi:Lon protease-like protein